MNCPRCASALEAVGHVKHCAHCGWRNSHDSDKGIAMIGEAVGAICPVCQGQLLSAQIEEETVAQCASCGGFMAEMESLQAIVARRRSGHAEGEKCTRPFHAAELERALSCPCCEGRMDTHPYFGGGNVVVNTCERCSLIWLDAGKLAIIECYVPHVYQNERTLTLRGGRYMGGPRDMPSLGCLWDTYWKPRPEPD
jgi:Zn-finger nucleic acid-binding protein